MKQISINGMNNENMDILTNRALCIQYEELLKEKDNYNSIIKSDKKSESEKKVAEIKLEDVKVSIKAHVMNGNKAFTTKSLKNRYLEMIALNLNGKTLDLVATEVKEMMKDVADNFYKATCDRKAKKMLNAISSDYEEICESIYDVLSRIELGAINVGVDFTLFNIDDDGNIETDSFWNEYVAIIFDGYKGIGATWTSSTNKRVDKLLNDLVWNKTVTVIKE